jgi:D-alanyl-lipoteichoic acid acyltransferase DltB (MBOAT superfamily)
MTLSRWLRDYLYVPLGGSRGKRSATYRNLMLTMLLGGLWHGAAWSFVLWGGLHGGWLAFERWQGERRQARGLPEPPDTVGRRVFNRFLIFHVVCLGWVLFRAGSVTVAWDVLSRLFTGWGPSPAITPAILLAIVVGIGSQYVSRGIVVRVQSAFSRLAPVLQGVVLALALAAIDGLGQEGVAAFIYFQF